MPFLLLLSQQGALLHELSHWHAVSVSSQPEVQSVDADHDLCLTCLSFAQIGGLAKFEVPTAPKMDGLQFHFMSVAVRSVAELSLLIARSRGPPEPV